MPSRRHFLASSAAFCTYALLREARALGPARTSVSARQWIARQSELASELSSNTLTQIQWHDAVNALAAEVDLEDMARMIRKASIGSVREAQLREPRRRFIHINSDGIEQRLPYSVALFDFSEVGVIPPHAHDNMASAHMVMEGRIRIRTFDRLADNDGSLTVRPTADTIAEVGHAAAMTPERDNVHWFEAQRGPAMTVDVVISGLDKTAAKSHEIRPLDFTSAQPKVDGSVKAPLISFEQSRQLYFARL